MRTLSLLAATAVFAAGCGPTCQSTCQRYFAEDQCDAGTGRELGEEIAECYTACNTAMMTVGPARTDADSVRNWDPLRNASAQKPVLINETEAALWMDCVWSFETQDECREFLGQGERRCALVP